MVETSCNFNSSVCLMIKTENIVGGAVKTNSIEFYTKLNYKISVKFSLSKFVFSGLLTCLHSTPLNLQLLI